MAAAIAALCIALFGRPNRQADSFAPVSCHGPHLPSSSRCPTRVIRSAHGASLQRQAGREVAWTRRHRMYPCVAK
jgi:hypothetical protein